MNFFGRPLDVRSFAKVLAVIVICWPGPRPVAHTHTDATKFSHGVETGLVAVDFFRHLAVHHRAPNTGQHSEVDWHVHWVFPPLDITCLRVDSCGGEALLSLNSLDENSSEIGSTGERSLCEATWVSPIELPLHLQMTGRPSFHQPTGFYSRAIDSISYQQRFCVLNC